MSERLTVPEWLNLCGNVENARRRVNEAAAKRVAGYISQDTDQIWSSLIAEANAAEEMGEALKILAGRLADDMAKTTRAHCNCTEAENGWSGVKPCPVHDPRFLVGRTPLDPGPFPRSKRKP